MKNVKKQKQKLSDFRYTLAVKSPFFWLYVDGVVSPSGAKQFIAKFMKVTQKEDNRIRILLKREERKRKQKKYEIIFI